MKVRYGFTGLRARASALSATALAAASLLLAPVQAHAISRDTVIDRAERWISKKVPYSQSRFHEGYRQDCSGFVSMAWKLERSYTSSTIADRGTRIPFSKLKPGDAIVRPGRHVSLFGGWKDKKNRTFWALEETTWGSHAKRRVRSIPAGAFALRRDGIKPAPRPIKIESTLGTLYRSPNSSPGFITL